MADSIILIGPKGTGKTKVGELLSKHLNIPFVQSDPYIVERVGMSITDYTHKHGWEAFRREESWTLYDIVMRYEGKRVVFAPGGGAVAHNQGEEYRQRNIAILNQMGVMCYILPFEIRTKADVAMNGSILSQRIDRDETSKDMRPLQAGTTSLEDSINLLKQRHDLYRRASHVQFYTGLDDEVTIARKLHFKISTGEIGKNFSRI